MSYKEPAAVNVPGPLKAADSSLPFYRGEVETKKNTESLDSRIVHPVSTSVESIDGANAEGTLRHESEQKSHVSSGGSKPAKEDAHNSKPCSKDEDIIAWVRRQPKRVNVKWSNYESFMNRFSPGEGLDIIEVLEGHPDQLRPDILHERSMRRHKKNSRLRSKSPRESESESKIIHRIRIQSPPIQYLLNRLMDKKNWSDSTPMTFLRPFQTFYCSLPFVKRFLKVLEREFHDDQNRNGDGTTYNSSLEQSDKIAFIDTDDPEQELGIASEIDMDDMILGLPDLNSNTTGNSTAKEHIRLYIDFVDEYIVPMWTEARKSSKPKVRFSDLPMHFRSGDVLFQPPVRAGHDQNNASNASSNTARSEGMAVHQDYWKLSHALYQEPSTVGLKEAKSGPIGPRMLKHQFILYCFHIDFDGDRYGPVQCRVDIPYYDGERDIRNLSVYPLRFNADTTQIHEELTTRAENFRSYVQQRHLSYDGWTLIHETIGATWGSNKKRVGAEHIEGEVIIDFKEGFQSDSGLIRPELSLPADVEGQYMSSLDPLLAEEVGMEVNWWSDTTRSKLRGTCGDFFVANEDTHVTQSSHMKKHDRVLRAFHEDGTVFNFDPDHLLLFPQRLIAYSFRARKFFVANIDYISIIKTPESPFKDLKIESENKRILKSLVGRHFQKRDIRRQNKNALLDQDFIRGKGSGLVILLHGVPGVGKTTTAEAVALDNRKPLFALTSGDLGSASKDVEAALRETFRLAAMWDCVLLLDEADLFLAKRDVGDLVRNSLVSVFLRVLDYYDGVLFLTTNRVGTVDEAFRSRIHLSLYYPPLRKKQAYEIFKLNIRRVKEIEDSKRDLCTEGENDQSALPPVEIDETSILNFATRHWENTIDYPSRRWNGRQIRNSFQIAYSLVNLNQISGAPSHYHDDYDDYNDDDVDYGDEPDVDTTHLRDQSTGATVASPTMSVQAQKTGKLDSSQFEIVERCIRRFDRYLDETRGPDADFMKSKNLRKDGFVESDDENRYHGRYRDARYPPSPHFGTSTRSPGFRDYQAQHLDRGGRPQRSPDRGREQTSYYGRRRAQVPVDDYDDYVGEPRRLRPEASSMSSPRSRQRDHYEGPDMGRSRTGVVPGPSPRSRRREEFDDEYE